MFDTYSIHDIQAALALTTTQAAATLFYEGDHWQQAAGYAGPRPDVTDANYTRVMQEIQRGFVARNIIGEIIDRHANGVVGRDVVWRMARADGADPSGTDQRRMDEAQAMLDGWIDRVAAQDTIDLAVATMATVGRAGLRLLVPAGLRDEAGNVPPGTIAQQLRHIYLDHPTAAECGTVTDPDTRHTAGIYVYQDDDGIVRAEIAYRDPADPATLIWRILAAGNDAAEQVYTLALAGDTIPIYQMQRRALVSDQVISQQKLYNLAATMKQRNVVLGGFLERTLLNAQLAGEKQVINGKEVFVPFPIAFGPGRINSFVGITETDAAGNTRTAQPEVQYRDPVPVDTFEQTELSAYMAILGEAHQLHYAIAGDATPSGESRIAAMADYVIDLLKTKKRVDDAWKWIGVTALNMAASLAGAPDYWAGLTVEADAQIDAGPVSTEMMRATVELVRDRLLSMDTGRSWIGVTDTAAEAQKVEQEQGSAALGAIDQINAILEIDRQAQAGGAEDGA